MPLYNPISRLLDLVERAHSSLTGIGADDHHNQQHAITGTGDHTSAATSGKMLKADANGLPVDASNTDTDVADAVTKKHTQQHAITATADHTSTATAGTILKADANGLPVNSAYEDILNALAKYDPPYWFCSHFLPADMMVNGESGGGVTWGDASLGIGVGSPSGSHTYATKTIVSPVDATFAKPRYFMVRCWLFSDTNQIIHIVSGGISSYTAEANTRNHIGFKIVNNALLGTVADGTNESTLPLATISTLDSLTLAVIFTPGVEARFYVDGVDKGAITADLPSSTSYASSMINASISNTAAETKVYYIRTIRTLQYE